MGFLASIFGGGKEKSAPAPVAPPPVPVAAPEPVEPASNIDPNRDKELAGAVAQRRELMARRGRSGLVTSRAKKRSSTKSSEKDSDTVVRAGMVVRK